MEEGIEAVVKKGRGRPKEYVKCKVCKQWKKPGIEHVCQEKPKEE